MKPLTPSIVATLLVFALGAAPGAAEYRSVKGEVVAPSCTVDDAGGPARESPAARTMRCARRGVPMAIQTSDGLFFVEGDYAANNNAKLLDFVAKTVVAKGTVTDRDGKTMINVAAMMVAR